ncbi:MAG: hypothetical protein PWP65_3 [Clostridia bacterium]|nr:hypothetical protein [Clostridia bacterium]
MNKVRRIKRHSLVVRFVHWSVAVSTFLLIFSGLGQLPIYKRYMVDKIPGLSWSSDFSITLTLHYVAAIWLVFAAIFHIVYHSLRREFALLPRRGDFKESFIIIKSMFGFCEEPPCEKYLAEQRLAYAFIAFSLLLLIVTGFIKVIKNFSGITFSDAVLNWATHLHNLGMVMIVIGIIAHLAAFILKANRPLLPSMFTGYVDADYVRKRHSLWCEQLQKKTSTGASRQGLTLERAVRLVAGSFIFAGLVVDALWWLPWFVGFMLLVSALTGFCPAETLLRQFGHQSQQEKVKV